MNAEVESRRDFIGKIGKIEVQENFSEIIKLFSKYLMYTNEDYMYNETYLESFCHEFLDFKKYVVLKNQIVVKIYQAILNRNNDLQVEIFIDQCWHYGVTNLEISKKINKNKVCRDKIEIKGKLKVDKKECIFFKEYSVIENGELIEEEINEIIQELKKWMEENQNE